jgi:hypothetical protein
MPFVSSFPFVSKAQADESAMKFGALLEQK